MTVRKFVKNEQFNGICQTLKKTNSCVFLNVVNRLNSTPNNLLKVKNDLKLYSKPVTLNVIHYEESNDQSEIELNNYTNEIRM